MFILLFLGLVVYMPASVWFIAWVGGAFGLMWGIVAFGLVVFITLLLMDIILGRL
jgi:hypothetical protein